jgi:hypothetical protein
MGAGITVQGKKWLDSQSGNTALSELRLRTPGCKSVPLCAGFKYVQEEHLYSVSV